MNIFICDIMGTYKEILNKGNDQKDIIAFVKNLQDMMELESIDQLVFSFESSDDMDVVMQCINEFSKYIRGTNIKLGIQFSGEYYLSEEGILKEFKGLGKISQTLFLLNNEEINNIYYADDSIINQEMTVTILNKANNTKHGNYNISFNKLIQFIPKSIDDRKGLKSLNCALEEYIDNSKKMNNVIK